MILIYKEQNRSVYHYVKISLKAFPIIWTYQINRE